MCIRDRAKMLALYLENLAFCVLFLVPAAGVQAYWQMDWSCLLYTSLMPVVLVLLGGLLWVIPHEKKEPPSWALEIQKTVSTWATRAAEGKSPLQLGVTSKVPVFEWTNLEQAGPRVYTGQTMLKVTCTADGTYYLRGEARGDYTGTRWDKPLSDAQLGDCLLYTSECPSKWQSHREKD